MNSQEKVPEHLVKEYEDNTLLNNLSLTPEQRLINHQKALNLMTTLQDSIKEFDAKRS